MVNIKQKEQKNSFDASQTPPEMPKITEQPLEQLPVEPEREGVVEKETPIEAPEQQIEQVKEQVAEVGEDRQQAKPVKISPVMKDDELVQDLKDVMSLNKPKQIKVLVYLAFKKGIHHAANIAKKLKDPYLMDEFHDTLVTELYSLLLKKGKIKKK